VTDLLLRSEASALLPPGLLQQLQQIRATNQTLSILEGRQGTSRRRKIWTGVRTWKPMLEDPMADIAPAPSLSSRPPAAPGAGLPSPALFYFRFRRASRYPVRSRRACWVRVSQVRSGLLLPCRARSRCRGRVGLVRRPGSRVGSDPDSIATVRFRFDGAHGTQAYISSPHES
jgi:hypothetical protein